LELAEDIFWIIWIIKIYKEEWLANLSLFMIL